MDICIFSWNVNGVQLIQIDETLKEYNPDMICLQETSTNLDHLFKNEQYQFKYRGVNNVLVLSKIEPIDVSYPNESVVTLQFEQFVLVNVQVNSTTDNSLKFYLESIKSNVIVCGSFNAISNRQLDIHNPKLKNAPGATQPEVDSFNNYLDHYIDSFRYFHPCEIKFTLWKQSRKVNKGWRTDYILVPRDFIESVKESDILDSITVSGIGTHAPCLLSLNLQPVSQPEPEPEPAYKKVPERIQPEFLIYQQIPERVPGERLPVNVDLRPLNTYIYTQGTFGTCTSSAICTSLKFSNPGFYGSRMFMYYNERKFRNNQGTDSGSFLTDGIKVLMQDGICQETTWPYISQNLTTKPSEQAYHEACLNKSNIIILNVPQDVYSMKKILSMGKPFIVGIRIYDYFTSLVASTTGRIRMPKEHEKYQTPKGHVAVVVGYNDTTGSWIVRNSWGAEWGHFGNFFLRYNYLLNPETCTDIWTVEFKK